MLFAPQIDRVCIIGVRCLALLACPIKTKKLGDCVPYVLKIVPVSRYITVLSNYCGKVRVGISKQVTATVGGLPIVIRFDHFLGLN